MSMLPPRPSPSSVSNLGLDIPNILTRTSPSQDEDEDREKESAPILGPVPFVAIPVVAGLGSEVTPMATILKDDDPIEPKKVWYLYICVCVCVCVYGCLCVF